MSRQIDFRAHEIDARVRAARPGDRLIGESLRRIADSWGLLADMQAIDGPPTRWPSAAEPKDEAIGPVGVAPLHEEVGQRLTANSLAVHLLKREGANVKAVQTIEQAVAEAREELALARTRAVRDSGG